MRQRLLNLRWFGWNISSERPGNTLSGTPALPPRFQNECSTIHAARVLQLFALFGGPVFVNVFYAQCMGSTQRVGRQNHANFHLEALHEPQWNNGVLGYSATEAVTEKQQQSLGMTTPNISEHEVRTCGPEAHVVLIALVIVLHNMHATLRHEIAPRVLFDGAPLRTFPDPIPLRLAHSKSATPLSLAFAPSCFDLSDSHPPEEKKNTRTTKQFF